MLDAALDLFLGSHCAGCARPGRMMCRPCRELVPVAASLAWPDPTPAGLVEPWALAPFEGAVRNVVTGHKDDGQWGHRRLLGAWLARAVEAATTHLDPAVPVLLVPVPSRPGTARRRGYDSTGAIVTAAVRLLSNQRPVTAAGLLVSRGGVRDQRHLAAEARRSNLAGSMWCPTDRLHRVRRRWHHGHVVVCDDVVTTGATLREAQRALEAVGLPPVAAATVAATARR